MHSMIDLETLGVTHDCVVLTLGAVKFDPFNTDEPTHPLYLRLNVDQQSELDRAIDPNTIIWWSKQSEQAQNEAFSDDNRISVEDVIAELNRYLVGIDKVWAQGPMFDINILEHLYKMVGQPLPWQYWQIRDSRTVFDMGDDSAKTGNGDAHNALSDAYCQAKAVQNIYKELGVKPKAK